MGAKSNLAVTLDGCILFTYNLYSDEKLDKFITKQYKNQLTIMKIILKC